MLWRLGHFLDVFPIILIVYNFECSDEFSQSKWLLKSDYWSSSSILGPHFFLIYFDNLPDVVSRIKLVFYADHTSLVASTKDKDHLATILGDNFRFM